MPHRCRCRHVTYALVLVALLSIGCMSGSAHAQGTELVVALAGEPVSLNPFVGGDFTSNDIMRHIYDALLTLDENKNFVPNLAVKFEPLGETAWLVELRRGVTFHNGEPFDAHAVKFTYDMILDPATNARGRSGIAGVTGVEVIDDYTVLIHTDSPMPTLPGRNIFGGTGSVAIVPPRYFAEVGHEGYAAHPIGTGPFKFVEHVRGRYIRLEANENYWGPKPKVDRITFRIIPEAATRVSALLSGEVDVAIDIPVDLAPQIKNSRHLKLISGTFGRGNQYWQMNPVGPFADRRVRLAIAHGVNFQEMYRALFGEYIMPLGVPLDPAMFGYNPHIQPWEYDPQKARALLAEAGYPNGFEVTLHTSTRYTSQRQLSEAIVAELQKLGIRANLVMSEAAAYLEKMANREAGPFYLISWGTLDLDADILVNMFHSESNFATWNDPVVDEMLELARHELDQERRRDLYWSALERLHEDVAYVAPYKEYWLIGANQRVDWEPILGRALYFRDASVQR